MLHAWLGRSRLLNSGTTNLRCYRNPLSTELAWHWRSGRICKSWWALVKHNTFLLLQTFISKDHSFPRTTEFQAESQNLPVSAEFLCFRGILQNSVILGLTVDLRYHLIDLHIIQSTNRQTSQELIACCVVYRQYLHTICSLSKVYLAQSMDFTCANLFTSWIVYKWNKSCRNS